MEKNDKLKGKKYSKLINDIQIEKNNPLKITFNKFGNFKEFHKKHNLLFIALISITLMSGNLILNYFRNDESKLICHDLSILIELLFNITFSLIFLNFSIFKHQYVSFLVIIICHIIFFAQSIKYQNNINILDTFHSFLYFFSYTQLFCLADVLGKKYLNLYMDGIYLFLSKIGLITSILLIIYDIIAYFSGFDDKYHGIIDTLFFHLKPFEFFINLCFSLLMQIGLWLAIYYFSPFHYIILDIIYNFLGIIVNIIQNRNNISDFYSKEQIITYFILYPIIIFQGFVFNEIIILNFCGLNKNTKLCIMERGGNDFDYSTDEDFSIDEDNYYNENEDKLFN